MTRSRLLVTYRISVSALAIMHSPRSADFRWPRSRRRQPTPPHSPNSNRLKKETAQPPQFPQDAPSCPAGSGFEHVPRLLVESLGIRCVDLTRAQHVHPDIPALQLVEPRACELALVSKSAWEGAALEMPPPRDPS